MTAENLKIAVTRKHITSSINSNHSFTQDDVDSWEPNHRAHAIAQWLADFRASLDVRHSMRNPQEQIDELLNSLKKTGWDGITENDFIDDFLIIADELKSDLSENHWDRYFNGWPDFNSES